jgi:hypothetical protein
MEQQTPVIYTESDVIIVPRKKKNTSNPDVIIVPHKKKVVPVVKPIPVVESVTKVIKKTSKWPCINEKCTGDKKYVKDMISVNPYVA